MSSQLEFAEVSQLTNKALIERLASAIHRLNMYKNRCSLFIGSTSTTTPFESREIIQHEIDEVLKELQERKLKIRGRVYYRSAFWHSRWDKTIKLTCEKSFLIRRAVRITHFRLTESGNRVTIELYFVVASKVYFLVLPNKKLPKIH